MTLPALVLVHGGGLAADCWELTVDEINRVARELTVLVVDLLVGDIESAGLRTSSSLVIRWEVSRCPEPSPSLARRGCAK